MKNTRKEFLKMSGLAGAGMFALSGCQSNGSGHRDDALEGPGIREREMQFNMHGFAAPPMDLVRVGIIGMGSRGNGSVARLQHLEGVEVRAICDVEESAIRVAEQRMEQIEGFRFTPDSYVGAEEWKRVCDRDDLDLILVCTPWHLHTPMCVYAMESGKHVAVEIPAAVTLEECYQLVETAERTRKHCYQMTNMCYGFFEMVTLNMARDGFFGEIIHGEGAYIHQLMRHNYDFNQYHDMWRLRENSRRNGNLYPHHGLGMVALIMNINHGDQLDYMVSMSSNDFMMKERARELAREEPFFEPFAEMTFRGNMNVSLLRTVQGRTIMLQHDVTSPRPYSRIHLISGTEGIARGFPAEQIATSHDGWLDENEYRDVVERYTPEITRRVGEMSRRIGGHGGADTMMLWRLVDSLRAGLPLDLTVYDAASWSSVIPMSEWSVANRSRPIDFPDFTAGTWRENRPVMDINLERVGDTGLV